jgi:hypothetical protein
MTCVCTTFLFVSKQAFGLPATLSYALGGICLLVAVVWFCVWYRKEKTLITNN